MISHLVTMVKCVVLKKGKRKLQRLEGFAVLLSRPFFTVVRLIGRMPCQCTRLYREFRRRVL